MAEAISTGTTSTGINPSRRYSFGSQRPSTEFDANVPAGVDPEAAWRFGNSTRGRRTGTTAAQRAGADPNYTPGYGRASNQNRTGASSLTPQGDWDSQFVPHLAAQMQPTSAAPSAADVNAAGARLDTPPPTPPAGGIPPAGPALPQSSAPSLPVLPSPGSTSGPQMQQINGTQSTVRQVTGLPAGQKAFSSFVPGQNSQTNLAKRTRPPVDPLS